MFALTLTFWSVIQIFMFCEFGKCVTDLFDGIPNIIFESEWYTFPIEIQKILPTLMVASQQPVVIQGFANLQCTREAFKKVDKYLKVKLNLFSHDFFFR